MKIIEARDLPVMDRASDLTDAFVEVIQSCLIWRAGRFLIVSNLTMELCKKNTLCVVIISIDK